jgi:hypothetical protein
VSNLATCLQYQVRQVLIVAQPDLALHNLGMTEAATTNVILPTDLFQELTDQARRSGLPLSAYLAFLSRVAARQHDVEFVDSLRFAFSKYPNALRRLAQ